MTAEQIAGAAGIILSLGFSFIPKLNTWYAGQTDQIKQAIMGGLMLIVGIVSYGLACLGWAEGFGIDVTCDQGGAIRLITALVSAFIANFVTYGATKYLRPESVKRIANGG